MNQVMRKALTAGTTFAIALGIGFVMQYGDALASRLGVDEPIGGPEARSARDAQAAIPEETVAVLAPARPPVDRGASLPVPQEAAVPQMEAIPRLDQPQGASDAEAVDGSAPVLARADALPAVEPDAAVPADVAACSPEMTAETLPLAMVRLSLTDACHPQAAVKIHHRGMMFSALTDAKGQLQVDVPALTAQALFIADFADGPGAAAAIVVPDIDDIDRAVLQWQGDEGVQVHALEFGAGYDDAGHVWSASTGTPEAAAEGTGGFMTTLGDPAISDAYHAEVYTFPSGHSARNGQVILNVEAEVTSGNCGRDVSAQSIQIAPQQDPHAVDLTMTMPDCDAIGEFLVLKNMFADLTLAAK